MHETSFKGSSFLGRELKRIDFLEETEWIRRMNKNKKEAKRGKKPKEEGLQKKIEIKRRMCREN